MIPLVVIRPEPGCQATERVALALGLPVHACPMFKVRPLAWELPDAASFDALLLGSANAVRHAGAALRHFRAKPAYAVGRTTADAATRAGLAVTASGTGGLQSLLPRILPAHRRLLRLAGRERVPLDLPAGISVIEREVYVLDPLPMPPELAALLAEPAIVALHSAEAARHFTAECERLGLDRTKIRIAALGPRIAAAAGQGWRALAGARAPNDTALLALAQQMCQAG